MKNFPLFISDFYKQSHPDQYPPGTEFVYSNTTPRSSRLSGVNEVVVFGLQYLVKEYLVDRFDKEFFSQPKEVVVNKFLRMMDNTLGKGSVNAERIAALHDLQYLPLSIKALPEGTLCPVGVPFMTIVNTKPEFYWLTNFVETLTQTVIWQAITSATIAHEYRKVLDSYANKTSDNPAFVDWQGHDFSMRGMSSVESGSVSGAGHLLSFSGTDTITAIEFLEEYYKADVENELVGASVPATEHAVCCAHGSLHNPKEIVEVYNEKTNEWEFSKFVF
jgi:nicotinamide phosphoribosyltransferase